MANVKITQLPALTNPASSDVLPIVDVDADTTNKVTIADLLENAGSGSASAPAFAFDGDSNTGIYRPAADQLAISTGGTGRLFIDSNGKIGINTSTPGDLVEVKTGLDRSLLIRGNRTSSPVDLFAGNPASGYGLRDMSFSANTLRFSTGASSGTTATERMRLDASGDLKLGGTIPSSPNISLNGNGSASFSNGIDAKGLWSRNNQTTDEAIKVTTSSGETKVLIEGDGSASFSSALDAKGLWSRGNLGTDEAIKVTTEGGNTNLLVLGDGTATFAGQTLIGSGTAGASKVRIDPTGFVNIQSNASAGEALRIFDNSSTQKITLSSDGSAEFTGRLYANQAVLATPAILSRHTQTGGLVFDGRNASAVTTSSISENGSATFAGNLGVGTTNPGNTLHLRGTNGVGMRIENTSNSISAYSTLESSGALQANISGAGVFTWVTGGSEKARIDNSGRLLIGTSISPTGGDAHARNAPLIIQGRIDSDADSGRINLQRGTAAEADQSVGTISFTDSSNNAYARISVEADAVTGTDDYPGRIKFQTTENGQPGPPTTRLTIKNNGHIGIGTVTPPRALTNANSVTLTTGTAPQYRLNATAADGADDDRAVFGLATSNSHFVSNAVPGDAVLRTTNGGNLLFGEGTTETMRITSTGQMRLAGAGITFNGDTATANELDDYEEGTFTPVLVFGNNTTGIVYNGRAGFYVKVGKVVHAWVYINLSSKGTATGAAAISQFPFTSEDINVSGLGNWPGAQPSRRQNQTSSNLALTMVDNSINCAITDGAGVSVTDSSFTNGTILEFALCYRAA